jgi:hypothetical protein
MNNTAFRNLSVSAMRQLILIAAAAIASSSMAAQQVSSDYLYAWTASADTAQPDFLAVFDARPSSVTHGQVIATAPVPGHKNRPHHTEYQMPGDHLLFANGFATGQTFIFDTSDPAHPKIAEQFGDVAGMMHPHSYVRLPNGNVLATFQMQHDSLGVEPGGIAELTKRGRLVRWTSANAPGIDRRVRPYSAAIIPRLDRIVTTTTDMDGTAEIPTLQLWRLSDMKLLKTFELPQGAGGDEASMTAEPRLLADGRTVLVSTFACGLYLLRGLDGPTPSGELVSSFPRKQATYCAVPVIAGHYYLVTVPAWSAVVSLDISNPSAPKEVSRLVLGRNDVPHWLALEPNHRRAVVTGYGDLAHRIVIANFDEKTGQLTLDSDWQVTGTPHGALFSLPRRKAPTHRLTVRQQAR